MAKFDQYGNPVFLSNPQGSFQTFGFDRANTTQSSGMSAAEPFVKFSFLLRFVRGSGNGDSRWSNGLTFTALSVDRPSMELETETLNSYNKKRIIYKSISYNKITISCYETSDGLISSMWAEYSSYHFGDFRQGQGGYSYDQTISRFNDNVSGFGFQPASGFDEMSDLESQNFFQKLEIYQLGSGVYEQINLINPKITSWNPDAFDSSTGNPLQLNFTLDYEAIENITNGTPQPIKNLQLDALTAYPFYYETPDVPGTNSQPVYENIPDRNGIVWDSPARLPTDSERLFGTANNISAGFVPGINSNQSGVPRNGGALGSFGLFSFGNDVGGNTTILNQRNNTLGNIAYNRISNNNFSGLGGSLVGAMISPSIGAALNKGGKTGNPTKDVPGAILSSLVPQGSVSASVYDSSIGAIGPKKKTSMGQQAATALAAGLMQTALQSKQSPNNMTQVSRSGIRINNAAMSNINSTRTTSQIGSRISTPENDIGNNIIASSVDIFKNFK